jgi:hypothetical protein
MSRIYNPVSMNDAKPILKQSHYGEELELQTMVRQAVGEGDEEYVSVTAPTNLPSGYELIVDIMDGSFWTVQVVRTSTISVRRSYVIGSLTN